ncbi:MAG: hypothetical protein L0922_03550 [Candidatus Mariimomonas ferrooxydans]
MRTIGIFFIVSGFFIFLASAGWAQEKKHHMMEMHDMAKHQMGAGEPVGVMGGHIHHTGSWMLSYRYMYMGMDGNRDGTDSVSTGDVLQDFMVTPTEMSMQMHMLGIMHSPSKSLH